MMINIQATIATVFILLASSGYASDINYDLVQFSQKEEVKVANDQMAVILSSIVQNKNANIATKQVNEDIKWATHEIGKNKNGVTSKTLGYQTYPQYKNSTIVGWTAKQQVRVESGDFENLAVLIGVLQGRLKVEDMRFYVCSSRRQEVQTDLIIKALNGYRKKAKVIATTLGGKDYRVVSVDVMEEGRYDMPMQRNYETGSMLMSSSEISTPAVDSGDSTISVTISGTIQIIF